jgi:predicted ATPase
VIEGLRVSRALPERRWHALPRLVPSLAGTQRSLRLTASTVEAETAMADEIGELLTAAAQSRPLVIVIEDVEHADQASWDVIDRLTVRLGSERILVCLTTDEAYGATARARFATCRRHYELRVRGLTGEDVHHWVGDLFTHGETAHACAAYLADREPISPLRAAHALHGLVDAGHLAFQGGAWRVVNASALVSSGGAPELNGVIAARLKALAPKTRAILGELALVGDAFELDVALAAGIGDEAELLDAIDEALAAAILREDGTEPGAAFVFVHRSVAGAAREAVDPMRLRRAHERIARGFEQVRPVALFEIAEHFDRAGLADRAFEYALLAAARAASVQAYPDAALAYSRARAHITTPVQRRRLDELIAQLPIRAGSAGVA